MSVGIERIWNAAASSCCASVSILPNTTSELVSAAFSNTGANILHGPHQSAQKSRNTMSLSSIVELKLSTVTSVVAMRDRIHAGRNILCTGRSFSRRSGGLARVLCLRLLAILTHELKPFRPQNVHAVTDAAGSHG